MMALSWLKLFMAAFRAARVLILGLALPLCAQTTSTTSNRPPYKLQWFALAPSSVLHIDGYELHETYDPETSERRDFIRVPGQSKAHQFYQHSRGIDVALVPACQSLLVEDDYTTKLSKLVMINLQSWVQKQISEAAVERYHEELKVEPSTFVNARAVEISADCNCVLLAVELTYASVASPERAQEANKLYPTRWYTVNVKDGALRAAPQPTNVRDDIER